jgi:hypothetical protein
MNDRLTRHPARLGVLALAAALALGACTNGAGATVAPASPATSPMMHESPSPSDAMMHESPSASGMMEHSAAPSASDAMMHESPSPTAP